MYRYFPVKNKLDVDFNVIEYTYIKMQYISLSQISTVNLNKLLKIV